MLLHAASGSGGTLDPGTVCMFDGEAVYIYNDGDDDHDGDGVGESVVTQKHIFGCFAALEMLVFAPVLKEKVWET